jgi:hypothetical protein
LHIPANFFRKGLSQATTRTRQKCPKNGNGAPDSARRSNLSTNLDRRSTQGVSDLDLVGFLHWNWPTQPESHRSGATQACQQQIRQSITTFGNRAAATTTTAPSPSTIAPPIASLITAPIAVPAPVVAVASIPAMAAIDMVRTRLECNHHQISWRVAHNDISYMRCVCIYDALTKS